MPRVNDDVQRAHLTSSDWRGDRFNPPSSLILEGMLEGVFMHGGHVIHTVESVSGSIPCFAQGEERNNIDWVSHKSTKYSVLSFNSTFATTGQTAPSINMSGRWISHSSAIDWTGCSSTVVIMTRRRWAVITLLSVCVRVPVHVCAWLSSCVSACV